MRANLLAEHLDGDMAEKRGAFCREREWELRNAIQGELSSEKLYAAYVQAREEASAKFPSMEKVGALKRLVAEVEHTREQAAEAEQALHSWMQENAPEASKRVRFE